MNGWSRAVGMHRRFIGDGIGTGGVVREIDAVVALINAVSVAGFQWVLNIPQIGGLGISAVRLGDGQILGGNASDIAPHARADNGAYDAAAVVVLPGLVPGKDCDLHDIAKTIQRYVSRATLAGIARVGDACTGYKGRRGERSEDRDCSRIHGSSLIVGQSRPLCGVGQLAGWRLGPAPMEHVPARPGAVKLAYFFTAGWTGGPTRGERFAPGPTMV